LFVLAGWCLDTGIKDGTNDITAYNITLKSAYASSAANCLHDIHKYDSPLSMIICCDSLATGVHAQALLLFKYFCEHI
jgi:hypothetical protein